MNISYYRKTKVKKEKLIENLKNEAKNLSIIITKNSDLKNITILNLYKEEWIQNTISVNKDLATLLPLTIFILEQKGELYIGTTDPSLLGNITNNPAIKNISNQIEKDIKQLIHTSANIKELKPSSVKLYSTKTCPYCTMEKQWLEEKNIEHRVIYVDENQEEAQKLVQKTGQMGVPVTEIEYKEQESTYIIGFDKDKLSKLLLNQ